MSVVNRVTKLEVAKWSRFWKEKVCTWLKISCRRFFANPAAAWLENQLALAPQVSDTTDINNNKMPILSTTDKWPGRIPWSIMAAIKNGINVSMAVSETTNNGEIIVWNRYSRTDFNNVQQLHTPCVEITVSLLWVSAFFWKKHLRISWLKNVPSTK